MIELLFRYKKLFYYQHASENWLLLIYLNIIPGFVKFSIVSYINVLNEDLMADIRRFPTRTQWLRSAEKVAVQLL